MVKKKVNLYGFKQKLNECTLKKTKHYLKKLNLYGLNKI